MNVFKHQLHLSSLLFLGCIFNFTEHRIFLECPRGYVEVAGSALPRIKYYLNEVCKIHLWMDLHKIYGSVTGFLSCMWENTVEHGTISLGLRSMHQLFWIKLATEINLKKWHYSPGNSKFILSLKEIQMWWSLARYSESTQTSLTLVTQ